MKLGVKRTVILVVSSPMTDGGWISTCVGAIFDQSVFELNNEIVNIKISLEKSNCLAIVLRAMFIYVTFAWTSKVVDSEGAGLRLGLRLKRDSKLLPAVVMYPC